MTGMNVGNTLPFMPSVTIREITQLKGLMNGLNVGIPLEYIITSLNTREFTLEKSLINVLNVGNLFHLAPASVIIRVFIYTGLRPYEFSECGKSFPESLALIQH